MTVAELQLALSQLPPTAIVQLGVMEPYGEGAEYVIDEATDVEYSPVKKIVTIH